LKWHMSHHSRGVKRPASDHEYCAPKHPRLEEPSPSSYRCRRCDNRFANRRELYLH
jgi:hypothetical protein